MSSDHPEDENRSAAIYICFVLIWYSFGFVLILLRRIRPRTHLHLDSEYANAYRVGRASEKYSSHRETLTSLKDPHRREKLWRIYYGQQQQCRIIDNEDQQKVPLIVGSTEKIIEN